MPVNLRWLLTCFFFFALLFPNSLFAQATGKLSGYVEDAKTGEPLIGVTVQLENTDLGSVTNQSGYFEILNIPAKSYNVKASYVGYKAVTKFNIVVRSGGNPDLTFELRETISELGGIVVEASPFEKMDETPNSIQKLTREEIATYPGGNNDIAKVVQSLPGVSGSVGFRNDVIIRGGAPNESVYYLDGVEIPNINHFATQGSAGGPVGLLNVSFIENVTLSTSSFPAQYDNVLSGVLQFEQRIGNPKERKVNFRLGASEAALTLEGPLVRPEENETADATFIVSVRRSYLQFLFKLIDLPFLPDYWDYQYKLNFKIDDKNELSWIGIGSLDNFKINPPKDASLEQLAVLEQVPIIKQWTSTLGLSWKRKLPAGFFRATLSGNILNNNFKRYADNENQQGLLFNTESVEDENKFRFELTNFLADWTLVMGILAQHSFYKNTSSNIRINNQYTTQINFFRYGVFLQASKPFLTERLIPSFGIRIDGNTFTEAGGNPLKTISPRFSLSYEFAPKWTINTSLGRYYKIPPYTVLGFKDNNGNYQNKDSKYIRSDHVVAGIEYLPRTSTRFTLEGFYKKYSQYPVSVAKNASLANLGGDFEVLGNEDISSTGLGRAYGLEFLYQQKLSKNFYGLLAYTLYWSEFTGMDQQNYIPSVWDNRHLLTFTGGYKLLNNWEVGVRLRYLGKAPYVPVDIATTTESYPIIVEDYSRLGEARLNAYNSTDIRVDKKWNFNRWTLDLFAEVTNIFNSKLPSDPTYTLVRDDQCNIQMPRTLSEVPDTNNSSPIPTIGIVIDF